MASKTSSSNSKVDTRFTTSVTNGHSHRYTHKVSGTSISRSKSTHMADGHTHKLDRAPDGSVIRILPENGHTHKIDPTKKVRT